MNQTIIAGKASIASLLHGKRRGEAKIDPQRVDMTRQLKRKQHIWEGTPNNVPCMLVAVARRIAAPSSSLPCAGARNVARMEEGTGQGA